MRKVMSYTLLGVIGLGLLWFGLSYLDVVMNNIEARPLADWNLFNLFI